ncbi:hypothetical protein CXF68_02905 [Tenacibaculum sp. Bg11-29]|uniref:hypothetical protein n=1 Tax=Tenacibaculum sp. Bg11-29 TaxID=2058306 RepID=UPI000C3242B1|nr:hypothetical protein [Tenacibaculum sp. Bg11-29]PKH49706.1 hypothetical protein CXF68_02905 [Tenacibaculum sp. Bg11-29]
MLRPVAPFVEYAINYDYISKVLCINKDKPALQCNGKCQLMQKLEKQQDDDFKSLRIVGEDYPIGFVELVSVKRKNILLKTILKLYSYKQNYFFLFSKRVFHPPII